MIVIRAGQSDDINRVTAIAKSCAQHMINRGIFQWNEHYPSKEVFEKDLNRSELFVIENGKLVIGAIVISTLMDEEYKEVKWLTPNENNRYIHRLCVDPAYQKNGYAKALLDFAENISKDQNVTSIRLDTFSQNPRNLKFYRNRDYIQLEQIYFHRQSEFPFYCFELVL
tara:strand:- start:1392 stop:1898 length:507 start_codon:yes stop_codon:yes gene_type:complete